MRKCDYNNNFIIHSHQFLISFSLFLALTYCSAALLSQDLFWVVQENLSTSQHPIEFPFLPIFFRSVWDMWKYVKISSVTTHPDIRRIFQEALFYAHDSVPRRSGLSRPWNKSVSRCPFIFIFVFCCQKKSAKVGGKHMRILFTTQRNYCLRKQPDERGFQTRTTSSFRP